MIIEINQTQNRPNPVFDIVNVITGEKFAGTNGFEMRKPTLSLLNGDQYSVDITFRFSKRIDGKRKLLLDVLCNDKVVGAIYERFIFQKKVLFFIPVGYGCSVLLINNSSLDIYEMGLGGDQHYWCFYKNDKLVAVVHKDLKVINNRDTYTAYIEDEECANAVCLFTLFSDEANYSNSGEVIKSKVSKEEYISLDSELMQNMIQHSFLELKQWTV